MLKNSHEQNVCVVGDLTVVLGTASFNDLKQVYDERDMVMADVMALPPTSYTDVNMECCSPSWPDHIVLSPYLYNIKEECTIIYNTAPLDKFPLLLGLNNNELLPLAQVRQANKSRINGTLVITGKEGSMGSDRVDIIPLRLCCHQNACLESGH